MNETEQVTLVRVRGRLRDIALPLRCPACGAAAGVPLRVERVFVREHRRQGVITHTTRGVTTYHVASISVPFCTACAARHMAERAATESPPSPLRTTVAMYGVVALVALAAALVFAAFIWNEIAGGWRPTLTFAAAIASGCAVFAGWFVVQAVNAWRASTTPPPTSITAAFDFGDRQMRRFEPEWREYRLRNAGYARAFTQANAARLWDDKGPLALRAARFRRIAGSLRIAAAAALIVVFVLLVLQAGAP
ncbi:hypothetical protein [Roseiflexus sp.]|uniref:hypothetical protein n=1 Tax=Roseiflexus sp. TaxID=2562120 RepID=UPI0021DBC1AA|nr:hypothetical protein [Roseiflexus sp.]GIW01741.1 MAG: hypothetical protein KatS3mg058_3144 [Roseiflexus sp.]